MSENILKALMQLFAIIARVDAQHDNSEDEGRKIVRLFLKQQLSQKLVNGYLKLFDDFVDQYQPKGSQQKVRKKTSLASVKVLRICTAINAELTQKQKFVVLLRLLEFVHSHDNVSEQELEFLSTVAETFNVAKTEYEQIQKLITRDNLDAVDEPGFLMMWQKERPDLSQCLQAPCEGLEDPVVVLRIESLNLFFVSYRGEMPLMLNGQHMMPSFIHVLNSGSSIRSPKLHHSIYYTDILSAYLSGADFEQVKLCAHELTYHFPFGNQGLQPLNFCEETGKLVGIMGGSGSGKSTLLNILNGNLKPSNGKVTINGIDVHNDRKKLEGVIGYIAQDDLLIEELSVYQNLYYNTKLCFGNHSSEQIHSMVQQTLSDLGLSEISHLRVGSPLDKTISGGQRKRLNIALELIREPMVLFVDEPTSGLSSRDSENIMDLLKELSLKGKLIFVVIHQPSSDIFKMFDRLLILDQGGYPVFNGNPIDSVTYFKRIINHADCEESECPVCGNVNPEQVFQMLEAKVVDEYGHLTSKRKVSPEEWHQHYLEHCEPKSEAPQESKTIRPGLYSIPGYLKQFSVFLKRDMLSKSANLQYLLITFLEAPVLAAILTFFMRYFVKDPIAGGQYIFSENENIPQYIFISVIVALFFGLTVSSEEIIRDKKVSKREQFLNLSRGSYLLSKISVMFLISAIQTLTYVWVGNLMLGVQGLSLYYWAMLFTASCFANLLGLNISATFNSAKVIYIIVPVLIIPQLLFSGVIVKFDKLHPSISSQTGVPFIGNIMASRWAYEGLAVVQATQNKFDSKFYELEKRKKYSNWKKDYWAREMKNRSGAARRLIASGDKNKELQQHLDLLRLEITRENQFIRGLDFTLAEMLHKDRINTDVLLELDHHIDKLVAHYRRVYNKAADAKEEIISEMTATEAQRNEYQAMQQDYSNRALDNFVTNKNDLNYIVAYNNRLVQKKDLIYSEPFQTPFFGSHFYAPNKIMLAKRIDTFSANLLVIWGMTVFLALLLYVDGLRKTGELFGRLIPRKPRQTTSPSVL